MRTTLSAERVKSGEVAGAWEVTAWRGSDYLGREVYLFYTKREAMAKARETVREEGGLGIWRKSRA